MKRSRLKIVEVPRPEGGGLVWDRYIRFRYRGIVWTYVQWGIPRQVKVKIRAVACHNIERDEKEEAWMRSQGVLRRDWKMTSERVPDKVLRELDAMHFGSRRKKKVR